uniref:HicB family n=1 Tax=Siphoviridae sp. ctS1E53 TaxID=2826340 RepID=A0A8S5MEB1_9CAUD|nr:MAG TPA: HicB family [Siphoviridae sp. ctS1E53]
MCPMGRPKSENPKATQVSVRLDAETMQKLKENAEQYSETYAQSLRRGIEMLNKAIKK